MNKAQGAERKAGFGDKLAQFIQRNRMLIFTLSIIAIVGLVVFLVWSVVSEQTAKAATEKAELLQEKYQKWQDEYDSARNKKYKEDYKGIARRYCRPAGLYYPFLYYPPGYPGNHTEARRNGTGGGQEPGLAEHAG